MKFHLQLKFPRSLQTCFSHLFIPFSAVGQVCFFTPPSLLVANVVPLPVEIEILGDLKTGGE